MTLAAGNVISQLWTETASVSKEGVPCNYVLFLERKNTCVHQYEQSEWYFGTLVDTQQWAQPVTAGVHGVRSKKCRPEVVE